MTVEVEYEDRYHGGVQCFIRSVEYDFWTRRGVLWMADGNCVDMSGCIAMFTAIDPEVSFITTMAGERKDTCYRREGGQWNAVESG